MFRWILSLFFIEARGRSLYPRYTHGYTIFFLYIIVEKFDAGQCCLLQFIHIEEDTSSRGSALFIFSMDEESHQLQQIQSISSFPASSSSSLQPDEPEEEASTLVERIPGHPSLGFANNNVNITAAHDSESMFIRDETCTSVAVVLTFWFFVSMTLILGVYGSINVTIGPSTSLLLQANPFFVQYVKVEDLNEPKPGLMLYGFYETPPLDVVSIWEETYNATVPAYSHEEWKYHLNKGAQLNISYHVKSTSSYSVYLVIALGNEGLAQWLEDPTYPNTTLSWNVIRGKGSIQQEIFASSSYYVALGNVNSDEVEVHLDLKLGICCTIQPGTLNDEWNANISYGPRWIVYILGGMTLLMLFAFYLLSKLQFARQRTNAVQFGQVASPSSPLLSHKDDDLSSWGSSYDALSHDEDESEDWLAASSLEGKPNQDAENQIVTRRLCAVCFDAPRDCFFLPCGHCVACFNCATRILEESGTCPVCRRNTRKVRKIFTV